LQLSLFIFATNESRLPSAEKQTATMEEERYKVPDSIQNNGAQSVKQKAKKYRAGE